MDFKEVAFFPGDESRWMHFKNKITPLYIHLHTQTQVNIICGLGRYEKLLVIIYTSCQERDRMQEIPRASRTTGPCLRTLLKSISVSTYFLSHLCFISSIIFLEDSNIHTLNSRSWSLCNGYFETENGISEPVSNSGLLSSVYFVLVFFFWRYECVSNFGQNWFTELCIVLTPSYSVLILSCIRLSE